MVSILMFFSLQDSDASTTHSLCGSCSCCTQKAERRGGRWSSQRFQQHRVSGYAFFCFLIFWDPEYSDISAMELPVAWNGISLHGGTREEWKRVWISPLVEPTNMFFLYMFFVFPLFSLSTCVPGPACYGCVMCCRFIYLPSPGCGSNQLKNHR